MDTKTFIEEAKKVHGNKYQYSNVNYINKTTKVCIICPEHGEFWQTPKAHISLGYGCKRCGRKVCAQKKSKTKEAFILQSREIHGWKYDYSKVNYVNSFSKVCIICPEHGEFWQTPHDHLKGNGCPACGNNKKRNGRLLTTTKFIEKAIAKHGNRYDYTKVDYTNCSTKVCIICPEHGEFWQTPNSHLSGQGCPLCRNKKISVSKTMRMDDFIYKSRKIHGEKYDYSKVKYTGIDNPVIITCPIHGDFIQRPHDHLSGHSCPKCGIRLSGAENQIYEFCKKYYPIAEQSNRSIINPFELDIFIPNINVAIEYNGLLWHSTDYKKERFYHLKKLDICRDKGITLLQVFEDEYVNHHDIVLNKIKHILKVDNNKEKIMGRKCSISEVNRNVAREFLEKYHIQGFASGTVHLGAFYNGKLVAVMSFKEERKNSNEWELVRFASNYNYICQGIGGKLFGYFIKTHTPASVKSFADRRWTINEKDNLYIKLGFHFEKYLPPDYRYYRPKDGIVRHHKFGFRKNILHKKYGLPLTMTEGEMTKNLGYSKIYDCGLIKYVWKKEMGK